MRNWLGVYYVPHPEERTFIERAQTQSDDFAEVTVSALSGPESHRVFGVPLARRGIQPVWLRVANRSSGPLRLQLLKIDPNYFTPLEGACVCHFSFIKRLAATGLLAWLFLPIVLLILPFKLVSAHRANRRMDDYFQALGFPLRSIEPGGVSEGFIYTLNQAGTRAVTVCLRTGAEGREYAFSIAVPGLDADYHRSPWITRQSHEVVDCDRAELAAKLKAQPRATTNAHATREGDPVNLIVIGDFEHVIGAFAARWDETETISPATCWRTVKSFLLGSEYRSSPISALHLFGRPQDFALQRIRGTINERLHLRLWWTAMRLEGRAVWVGQVSRDIGVRPTWRTWNLTTHRIDPNVDEARDYVLEDLFDAERIVAAGYLDGVGACRKEAPRRNLTGDPYYTDGKRAVIMVSDVRTVPDFIRWS